MPRKGKLAQRRDRRVQQTLKREIARNAAEVRKLASEVHEEDLGTTGPIRPLRIKSQLTAPRVTMVSKRVAQPPIFAGKNMSNAIVARPKVTSLDLPDDMERYMRCVVHPFDAPACKKPHMPAQSSYTQKLYTKIIVSTNSGGVAYATFSPMYVNDQPALNGTTVLSSASGTGNGTNTQSAQFLNAPFSTPALVPMTAVIGDVGVGSVKARTVSASLRFSCTTPLANVGGYGVGGQLPPGIRQVKYGGGTGVTPADVQLQQIRQARSVSFVTPNTINWVPYLGEDHVFPNAQYFTPPSSMYHADGTASGLNFDGYLADSPLFFVVQCPPGTSLQWVVEAVCNVEYSATQLVTNSASPQPVQFTDASPVSHNPHCLSVTHALAQAESLRATTAHTPEHHANFIDNFAHHLSSDIHKTIHAFAGGVKKFISDPRVAIAAGAAGIAASLKGLPRAVARIPTSSVTIEELAEDGAMVAV